MTIVSPITAFCDMLSSQTGTSVILGYPDDTQPGIYVWPWLFKEDISYKNIPPRDSKRTISPSATNIHILVIVRPSLTLDGLKKLEAAYQAILDRPILELDGKTIRILIEPLGMNDITALFNAAAIPLTICLPVELTCIINENP